MARRRKVSRVYGLDAETYDSLMAYQGGKCAICRVRKPVAVDHDHRQARLDGHPHDQGCPSCVRGLVCMVCNDVLAHFRDDPAAGLRLSAYLHEPPLRRMLAGSTPNPGE